MTKPRALDRYTFGKTQTCFGCGPHNPRGWQLEFSRSDDAVVTHYTPSEGEEGPPGIFHGGLQTTLADELAGWTLVGLRERMGFTSSMQVRFVRPVRIGIEVVGRGRIIRDNSDTATVKVTLEQDGKLCLSARIMYMLPDTKSLERILDRPVDEGWKRFCRPPVI